MLIAHKILIINNGSQDTPVIKNFLLKTDTESHSQIDIIKENYQNGFGNP